MREHQRVANPGLGGRTPQFGVSSFFTRPHVDHMEHARSLHKSDPEGVKLLSVAQAGPDKCLSQPGPIAIDSRANCRARACRCKELEHTAVQSLRGCTSTYLPVDEIILREDRAVAVDETNDERRILLHRSTSWGDRGQKGQMKCK